ncbi:hypothetical protein [Dyadobacter chenhuakuii]|uniref:Uncharacterized protein n=1 Tax=Dyadobacter chenhuakuii TaxID=2909339 RepID=A0A9X1QHV4_9BACT|nr:hypothetical protein [Dyadobacter chenhuakuii]MCF2501695.1 hypothetical protein [Dyadobacter chenhuakuii]
MMNDNSKTKRLLDKVLKTEQLVAEIAATEIVFSPALITLNKIPVVRRGTVNVIQGRAGSHKSRLAELFCSMLLREENEPELSLGFEKNKDEALTVCYIDTERNFKEEFPSSVKRIVENAGYILPSDVPNFRFTSFKDIERKDRQEVLQKYIENLRSFTPNSLLVILDVVTDFIANFNDPVESMRLFDYISILTTEYNSTFLLIIHENPGSSKARGHSGTESLNKASTVMRIGYQKEIASSSSQGLTLEFLKNRYSGKLAPIALQFSDETQSLNIGGNILGSMVGNEKGVAPLSLIQAKLAEYIIEPIEQKHLLAMLRKDFKCSFNTLKSRLEEIESTPLEIVTVDSVTCQLKINQSSGKPTIYSLVNLDLEKRLVA